MEIASSFVKITFSLTYSRWELHSTRLGFQRSSSSQHLEPPYQSHPLRLASFVLPIGFHLNEWPHPRHQKDYDADWQSMRPSLKTWLLLWPLEKRGQYFSLLTRGQGKKIPYINLVVAEKRPLKIFDRGIRSDL